MARPPGLLDEVLSNLNIMLGDALGKLKDLKIHIKELDKRQKVEQRALSRSVERVQSMGYAWDNQVINPAIRPAMAFLSNEIPLLDDISDSGMLSVLNELIRSMEGKRRKLIKIIDKTPRNSLVWNRPDEDEDVDVEEDEMLDDAVEDEEDEEDEDTIEEGETPDEY